MLPLSGLCPPHHDDVTNPRHYMFYDTEVKKMIHLALTAEEFQGWCKGNTMKYRYRAGKKIYDGLTTEQSIMKDVKKADEFEDIAYNAKMGDI